MSTSRSPLFDDQHGEQRRTALRIMQQSSPRELTLRLARNIRSTFAPLWADAAVRRGVLELVGAAVTVGVVLVVISGPVRDAKAEREYREAQAEARMKARLFTKYDRAMIAEGERMTFPVAAYPQDEPKK